MSPRTGPRKSPAPPKNLSDLNLANELARVDGLHPKERAAATRNPYSPVVLLVTILATTGVLAYGAFLLNPANRGDMIPWLIVIVAEVILVFHALMSMWTMLIGYGKQPPFDFFEAQGELFSPRLNERIGAQDDPTQWPLHLNGQQVSVAALITVYGEPIDMIRRTATAAIAMSGMHSTYILDDGDSDEVRDLANELQCGYIRRLGSAGAKAGNVNNGLTVAKEDFFIILDADFVAEPEFIVEMLPHMHDSNVAFVQAPQTYGNLHNFISRGAGFMQAMFYRFVQPGRNSFNAAFSVGTNVLYRRDAVMDIGGIFTGSKSEDVWTSLMLHERGWRSVFVPKKLATGDTPETVEAYSKQQLRWATGGFEILFNHNPLGRKRKLTMDQRLMYFVTSTHYLTGIAPGLLLFLPALEVFFDLRPVDLDVGPIQWVLFYAGFYVLQIVLAALVAGTFRPEVLLLAANSFPIYFKALRNAFLGVEQKWDVTGVTGGNASAFNFIRPQVFTFIFLLMTTLVSLWRDWSMQQFNLATFWAFTNASIVGAFILAAFSEDWTARKASRQPGGTPRRGQADVEALPQHTQPVLDRSKIIGAGQNRDALLGTVQDRVPELAGVASTPRSTSTDNHTPLRAAPTAVPQDHNRAADAKASRS